MWYKNFDIDTSILNENIIKIRNKWIEYGVEEVMISSIFVKKVLDLVPLLEKLMMNCVFYVPLTNFILFQMITSLESTYEGMVYIYLRQVWTF